MVSGRTPTGPAGRVVWDTRRHRRLTAPAASLLPYLDRDRHPDLSPH